MDSGTLSIFSCDSGKYFCKRIITELEKILKENEKISTPSTKEIVYANGEIKTVIHNNIRGGDIYIVQSIDDPLSKRSINDNLFAMLTAVDAAHFSDADSITVVLPQFPYARQERRKGREGITAKLIAKYLEAAGVDRVITLDIHAEAIQGFFKHAKLENLHASGIFIDYFKKLNLPQENTVIVAPDMGSAERARYYSNNLHYGVAVIDKARVYSKVSTIESMRIVGNVENKDLIIIDDMIATGGTLIHAVDALKKNGAKDIYVATSLPYFNGKAIQLFDDAYKDGKIKKVLGTDAVYRGDDFVKEHEWYEEISMAPLFAKVIYNINKKLSVSSLLR